MKFNSINLHLNNQWLKALSLIFGYMFWFVLVQNQKIDTMINIPICFYGVKENYDVIAPENIKVKLFGKRNDLANSDISQIAAAHIDVTKLNNAGEYKVDLTSNDIFLHNKIKLIDYSPSTISIQLKEKK